MPEFRVVLSRPLYGGNVGSIARAMKNFGASELFLVNPEAQLTGEAEKFAKHALDILESARTAKSIKAACRGCTLIAGTTGKTDRFRRGIKNCVTPRELAGMVGKDDKMALVFGSEGVGLTEKELDECDVICSIPASAEYPVMNLSHAAAVMLYAVCANGKGFRHFKAADRRTILQLEKMFAGIVAGLPEVHDKRKVCRAFNAVVSRARPAGDEVQALLAAMNAMGKKVKKN